MDGCFVRWTSKQVFEMPHSFFNLKGIKGVKALRHLSKKGRAIAYLGLAVCIHSGYEYTGPKPRYKFNQFIIIGMLGIWYMIDSEGMARLFLSIEMHIKHAQIP